MPTAEPSAECRARSALPSECRVPQLNLIIYLPREPRAGGRSWSSVRGRCVSPTQCCSIHSVTGVLSDYYERQGQVVALPHGHPAEDVHRQTRRRLPPHKRKR